MSDAHEDGPRCAVSARPRVSPDYGINTFTATRPAPRAHAVGLCLVRHAARAGRLARTGKRRHSLARMLEKSGVNVHSGSRPAHHDTAGGRATGATPAHWDGARPLCKSTDAAHTAREAFSERPASPAEIINDFSFRESSGGAPRNSRETLILRALILILYRALLKRRGFLKGPSCRKHGRRSTQCPTANPT